MYSIARLTQHGHDAFFRIRTIRQFIRGCFKNKKQMKIVKFGGKSLANGEGINTV
jgi:hypothetical protein